jgi:hypothetical protein
MPDSPTPEQAEIEPVPLTERRQLAALLRAALKRPEPRVEPLPRPEEVERWIKLAYLAGVEYGRHLEGGERR